MTAPRRRRWFRFSLVALFIAVGFALICWQATVEDGGHDDLWVGQWLLLVIIPIFMVTALGAFVAIILAGIAAATFLLGLLVRATNKAVPVEHRQRVEAGSDAT